MSPPKGIKLADVQSYIEANPTPSNGSVWKALAAGAGGLWVMGMVALVGMWAKQGVTQQQMEDYVDRHSPYISDKKLISDTSSRHENELGRISGRQERVLDRLGIIEAKQIQDEQQFIDYKAKQEKNNDLVAGYMESLKTKK